MTEHDLIMQVYSARSEVSKLESDLDTIKAELKAAQAREAQALNTLDDWVNGDHRKMELPLDEKPLAAPQGFYWDKESNSFQREVMEPEIDEMEEVQPPSPEEVDADRIHAAAEAETIDTSDD